jgi:hypothetical protein
MDLSPSQSSACAVAAATAKAIATAMGAVVKTRRIVIESSQK